MRPLAKRSLGIRITGDQTVFVELEKVLGRVRLRRAGTCPLPQDEARPLPGQSGSRPPESPRGPDAGNLPEGIPPTHKPDEVILGLPRRAIVLRTLELPALDQKDLPALLAYEIERHLPFPVEEACYSFQPLAQEGGKIKVLLAAARRADVERHLEPLARLGLQPTAVDVSAFAAANALLYRERPKPGEAVSLIGIDSGQAEVSVLREGILASSRAVSLENGAVEPLLREMARTQGNGGTAPATIRISGGSQELCLRLKEALGHPVEEWSPAAPAVDASAYGLALKGLVTLPLRIDLLPPERKRKRRERAVVVMFTLLALIGILGVALAVSSAYRDQRTLDRIGRQIAGVKAQVAEVEALKAEFTTLRNQLQVLEGIREERGRALLALRELLTLLPGDVALTEFSLEGNKLQIRGSTGASPSELIAALERSPFFENAAFTSPIAAQGRDRQGFQLQAFIKGKEPAKDTGKDAAWGPGR